VILDLLETLSLHGPLRAFWKNRDVQRFDSHWVGAWLFGQWRNWRRTSRDDIPADSREHVL